MSEHFLELFEIHFHSVLYQYAVFAFLVSERPRNVLRQFESERKPVLAFHNLFVFELKPYQLIVKQWNAPFPAFLFLFLTMPILGYRLGRMNDDVFVIGTPIYR